jgi:hypothetical protein
MFAKQKQIRFLLPFAALLLTLSSTTAGCGGTPTPTPKPQPTFVLRVEPETKVPVGGSASIVAKVTPLEKLDLKWSVIGEAGGTVKPDTGEHVVYTAGNKEGIVFVVAEGKTASGVPVKETVTLTIVGAPVPLAQVTPTLVLQPLTAMPTNPTPTICPSFRPRLRGAANFTGTVEIKTPANCTTGLPAETMVIVAGTYEGIPSGVDIWVLAYPPNMVYYPQSPNASVGEKMKWGDGRWQVQAYLGEKGGLPEWFDIVVILADQKTSQFLSNWVRDGYARNWQNYVGIPATTLEPMNITEKGYITVQTKD